MAANEENTNVLRGKDEVADNIAASVDDVPDPDEDDLDDLDGESRFGG